MTHIQFRSEIELSVLRNEFSSMKNEFGFCIPIKLNLIHNLIKFSTLFNLRVMIPIKFGWSTIHSNEVQSKQFHFNKPEKSIHVIEIYLWIRWTYSNWVDDESNILIPERTSVQPFEVAKFWN